LDCRQNISVSTYSTLVEEGIDELAIKMYGMA
jgi:hypothetical protein